MAVKTLRNLGRSIELGGIVIPKFGANSNQCLSTFQVDKSGSLSTVKNMWESKAHLLGEAARAIRHMDVNNEIYGAPAEMLRKRFDK